MIAILVAIGCVAIFAAALYLRKTMPWPFEYEGQKYRRMPDGTFQDALKTPITDAALIAKLVPAYEEAKYGAPDGPDWNTDNS